MDYPFHNHIAKKVLKISSNIEKRNYNKRPLLGYINTGCKIFEIIFKPFTIVFVVVLFCLVCILLFGVGGMFGKQLTRNYYNILTN